MKLKPQLLLISHTSNFIGGAEDDFERMLKYIYGLNKYELHVLFPEGPRKEIWKKYCKRYGLYHWGWLPVINEGLYNYIKYILKFFIQALQILRFVKGKKYDLCIVNVVVLIWPILIMSFNKTKILVLVKEHIEPSSIRKFVYKLISKRVNFVISNSLTLANEFIPFVGPDKIATIYSVIEDNINIANKELRSKLKDSDFKNLKSKLYFKIINVGGICTRKNQLLLLQTLDILLRKNYNFRILLIIVGKLSLNEKYGIMVRNYIKEHNLSNYCILTGELEKRNLYELYTYIDAVIISSISEGLPLVINEAMHFGKPVISTKVGGIPEIIKSGYNGLLAGLTPDSLAESLLKLVNDKVLYDNISANSVLTHDKYFNFRTNMNKLQNIIDKIIDI